MNSLFVLLGIESWKHVLGALLLPPVPLLVLVAAGAWRMARGRRLGASLVAGGVVLLWLCACSGTGVWLSRWLLDPPAALSAKRIDEIRNLGPARKNMAIVVLGGGAEPLAPEYGASNLSPTSAERLRYAVWLARATGVPVAFSGGIGWGGTGTQAEGEIGARVAKQEYGLAPQWTEDRSRDTRENAVRSVALLRQAGVSHLLIVTHDWHMPRALRAFRRAADGRIVIEAAPMGLADSVQMPPLAWLPSGEGTTRVRRVLHEVLGLMMGA